MLYARNNNSWFTREAIDSVESLTLKLGGDVIASDACNSDNEGVLCHGYSHFLDKFVLRMLCETTHKDNIFR